MIVINILLLLALLVLKGTCEEVLDKFLVPGKCKRQWRKDGDLKGRCFGLKELKEFDEVKHLESITSSEQCRAICCNLADKCVSWQYQKSKKECRIGGPVRLGLESAKTDSWCDPNQPQIWNGKRKGKSSNYIPGLQTTCEYGADLPHQCFGLGPERLNGKESAESCAADCCKDPECEMYQWMEGRGCFYGSSKGVWCEEEQLLPYEGSRKCIKDFCGGREQEFGIA